MLLNVTFEKLGLAHGFTLLATLIQTIKNMNLGCKYNECTAEIFQKLLLMRHNLWLFKHVYIIAVLRLNYSIRYGEASS